MEAHRSIVELRGAIQAGFALNDGFSLKYRFSSRTCLLICHL
jgi:hypothetical protein